MPTVTTKPRQIPADYLRQGDWIAVFDDTNTVCGYAPAAERGHHIHWERIAEVQPTPFLPDMVKVLLERDDQPGPITTRVARFRGTEHVAVRELLSVDAT